MHEMDVDIALLLEEIARLRAENDQLRELATRDELTGCPNRRALTEAMEREVARSRRYNMPLCLAVVDLDDFKAFNDTQGHAAGDQLLRHCADAWRGELRGEDVLARLGGDEFVLILPNADRDEGRTVLRRVLAATPMGQHASGGVALHIIGEAGAETLERADTDLYTEKGRKRALRPVDRPGARS